MCFASKKDAKDYIKSNRGINVKIHAYHCWRCDADFHNFGMLRSEKEGRHRSTTEGRRRGGRSEEDEVSGVETCQS